MPKLTKGLLLVIDGTDGSGKKTQTDLLYNYLKNEGYAVHKMSFPSHNEPSGFLVDQYLNGVYGKNANDVNPQAASILYAVNRYDKSQTFIKPALANNEIVIADRFVAANMGHQGGKFDSREKMVEYFQWLYELEHKILGTPIPDMNIILHVSPEINTKLIANRGNVQDIHEKDPEHLKRAELAYLTMAELFPNDITLIECVENGQIMPREKIHELIKQKVRQLLVTN